MIKGTRILIGEDARTYVDTISTLRDCLHRS
jgi:hypothetical protein